MEKEQLIKCKNEIIRKFKLHKFDNINYEKFLEIYQLSKDILIEYGIELKEREFAQEILELTNSSYKAMRFVNQAPRILKQYEISAEQILKIRQNVIKGRRLHIDDMLSISELKAIFDSEEYYLPLKESDYYIQIFDIPELNQKRIKKDTKAKTRILSKEKISEEDVLSFRREVIRKENLHRRDSLTYSRCREIFDRKYIVLSEAEFMIKILDISFKSYNEARYNPNKTVWILSNESPSDETLEELKQEIIVRERLHIQDLIDYNKFRETFDKYYTPLTEVEFAKRMLDITEASLRTIKSNGKKAVILKDLKVNEKSILEFRKKVIKHNNLYIQQRISYKKLKKIYNENYFPLSEVEFAEKILDITRENYQQLKYIKNRTAIILKNEIILEEEIRQIQKTIKQNYRVGENIDINAVNEMYTRYPIRLSKKDYAEQILNISRSQFKDMKSKKTKVSLEIGEEEFTKNLFQILNKDGYYMGYKVNLEQFEKLYKKFENRVTRRKFAQILGIEYNLLMKELKVPILNRRIKKAKAKFKENVKENQVSFHTLKEMKSFCEENQISFEEFTKYILSIYFIDTERLKLLIEQKQGVWYGGKKISCSTEFTKKYDSEIMKIAKDIARSLCRRYGLKGLDEEYTAEATLYIIEKCGDLEANYGEDEVTLLTRIKQRTRLALKGKIITDNFVVRKTSITKYYNSEDDIEIPDKKTNVEKEALRNLEESQEYKKEGIEKVIIRILKEIESGYDVDDVLEKEALRLECDKNELVLKMQDFYIGMKKKEKLH